MPRAKITKSFFDAIPYSDDGRQITYCDEELSGFYLIVGKTAKTYKIQKDLRGRSVSYTIGRHGTVTPAQAREIARQKLFEIASGINPNESKQKRDIDNITIYEVFENYCAARKKLKQRTIDDYRYYLDFYMSDWRNKKILSITKEEVVNKHIAVGEKHGPVVANRSMRLIRALVNHAIKAHDLNMNNPVSYLSHVKGWFPEKRRENFIKSRDLKAWWNAVDNLDNEDYRDLFRLLLFTGMRRDEGAGLEWKNVSFEDRVFTIPETKNGDPLSLPMSDFVYDLLLKRHEKYGHRKFVFPAKSKTGFITPPKKGVKKVVDESGVEFTCHDLRRTFATYGESLDISQYSLSRLMNHKVAGVTARYIVVNVERLREPIQQIADYILKNAEKA